MNKQEAFRQAKAIYPGLKPSRASSVTLTNDGQGVIIAGHDEAVMMVLHNATDIQRLMSMCQLAIEQRKQSK